MSASENIAKFNAYLAEQYGPYTPPTGYAAYAHDLRDLAATLELREPDLPEPRYANQGLNIQIHTAEARDVVQAAKTLNVDVNVSDGYTTAEADWGTIHVKYVHIDNASMTRYKRDLGNQRDRGDN